MGDIIVGIDIGTSKVCTLIGRVNKENQLDILGKGMEACTGVKKGVIVDIESTSSSILTSIRQAEAMANLKVVSAYANIIGSHVSVVNSRGFVNVSAEDREITVKDVEKVLYNARSISIPEDRQIIDVIPRQYIIDGYDEIIDPVGMVGLKLEVEADVVAGKITSVQNIIKSMERSNIRVDGLVVEAFANGESVLSVDERDMGVIMIDVGGGVTDISVFKNKKLIFYDSIPVGGDHITNDISIGLRISVAEAEKIKREYELALTSLIKNDQEVTVFDSGENRKKIVKVSEIVEIIEARVYEIFTLSSKLLQRAGVSGKCGGVVLAGGGISYVDGSVQIATEIFEIPVRIASFRHLGVPSLEYGTAAGIVKFVSGNVKGSSHGSEVRALKQKSTSSKQGFFKKLGKFFSDLF